ncbi:fungal-specific transcription factor domain-containing protein [Stachybotrys elegans]|uniref:Fungal-specific transcription factor domain-containing protein n=1 Tax=Stachybotrys elegans TaxID=80388 RepID=A0A8K0T508_9HYPO|nr:fungal-specific transcription factor domain-containing protein [Stachybotrys elegans]
MDGPQYPSNGINANSAQTYPSPTAISPHQLQSPLPQTLPPLQPPASTMQPLYQSHPHTPRTPGTPNTPNSNQLPSYQQQSSQPGSRPGVYSMAQNHYQPHQGYGTSAGMMPQATTAASHPQPIAPAPAGGRVGPPVLRPMPPGGLGMQPGVNVQSPYGQGPLMQPNSVLQEGEQPTHVVGSQGRRGILPSAPGRPAAPAAGTNPKNTVVPVKDADGKFPCPHCTKTYLHAKHLKRHLLRHTGDRPYMCVLCRDTFSRSDILKRHFQKCSIRRGNPTGASHLSHPQAHVKKNAQAQKPLGNEGDLNHLNGLSNMPGDGMVHPFGMVPVSDGMNNMPGDQNQLSRSGSMNRIDNGGNPDRRGMGGPVMGGSQPYGGDVPSMGNQQMPNYSMPPGQNGMSMYPGSNPNQPSGLDWSQMFQSGAHQPYVNHAFPPNLGQTQIGIKTDPNTESGATATRASDNLIYSNRGMPSNTSNTYNQLSHQLLDFFYPPNQAVDPDMAGMNLYFSPDNIKDFLDKYTHFHVHIPLLHVPTFEITTVHTGLLAAMCCVGACYSDRVDAANVREMMDFLWLALERGCKMFYPMQMQESMRAPTKVDLEELQAISLTIILHVWNGTPQQRDRARKGLPLLASQARKLDMLRVSQDPLLYSPLHHGESNAATFTADSFRWECWLEQERRLRVMYSIFLCDASFGLYFNFPSQFDPFEIQLPLPSDDAAWDAANHRDCASALGLNGPEAAKMLNPFGTRQPKQPEMDWVLKVLLNASYDIQPGSTTLYGKFILIHAIMVLVRRAQVDGASTQLHNYGSPSPADWMSNSASTNGRMTPVEGAAQNMDPKSLRAVCTALDKFKANWDVDMGSQFPPSGTNNPRRHGFSRDGVHFYWLAKYMLKHTRSSDLQLPADTRFMQVIRLLKSVRAWAMSDGAARGEELGSVGEIDDDYGAVDLTLEMAQLFKPVPRVVEDAGTVSVKTEMGQ